MKKKLISLLTAIICCGLFTVGISAEEITKTFNMASTVGVYEGESTITYNFVDLSIGQSKNETIIINAPAEITAITLEISGTKNVSDTFTRYTKEAFYFKKSTNSNDFYLNVLGNGTFFVRDGELCLAAFDRINTVSLNFTAVGKTTDYLVYDKIVSNKSFPIKINTLATTEDNTLANIVYGCINANLDMTMNVTKTHTEYNYPILSTTGGLVQNRFAITKLSDRWGNGGVYAGFASQVADFFDGQSNGKIVFEIVAGSDQITGGRFTNTMIAPALFPTTPQISNDDIVLFFNYNTTGSIAVSAAIDTNNNTITFDMAEVLDDFGGLTKANLEDIYYGLCTAYGVENGIAVRNVTLSYEAYEETVTTTAAVVIPEIITTENTEVQETVGIDDDDEYIPEDEEAWLECDDITLVESGDAYTEEDEDINPPTGVDIELCGFGAIFGFVGMALARKRK